ncbi:MarR family winged helix-turn-helix transcriptional regulator [Cohnella silvisoli]|uniref:MarR family winged helix-turn-helix transcriptional regulator n=1 Tax=Cohnella silvisoli TaxID=2873699 RepID=A0ABV1KQB8_9BACL|nr:MarR family winged helix-turn-helix transcriptional regulator [Cohnella silvisoli]MCD9022171.1 MarR family winged helix-turn-helix transcriptional regulator [Cohnella silvisoli]
MQDAKSPNYELTLLFSMAFRTAIDELHAELEQRGFGDVRPSHGFVFQRLAAQGATGIELAQHMGITKQAASLTVDYLEQHGYVKREPHPTDRRGKLIVLTAHGWECIRETESIFTAIESRWRDLLGEETMEKMRLDLRRIIQSSKAANPYSFRPPVW